ncbi:hypothetical protein AGLY_013399 [Aphis glycines]|uniref:Uncharacterized protein n=1 Tax=Aphis glycines TaxID=307491 RepID=A0A6G0T675_APHGL|nr:hypothetical protein AGLY_013399 [Aphis glycines]
MSIITNLFFKRKNSYTFYTIVFNMLNYIVHICSLFSKIKKFQIYGKQSIVKMHKTLVIATFVIQSYTLKINDLCQIIFTLSFKTILFPNPYNFIFINRLFFGVITDQSSSIFLCCLIKESSCIYPIAIIRSYQTDMRKLKTHVHCAQISVRLCPYVIPVARSKRFTTSLALTYLPIKRAIRAIYTKLADNLNVLVYLMHEKPAKVLYKNIFLRHHLSIYYIHTLQNDKIRCFTIKKIISNKHNKFNDFGKKLNQSTTHC